MKGGVIILIIVKYLCQLIGSDSVFMRWPKDKKESKKWKEKQKSNRAIQEGKLREAKRKPRTYPTMSWIVLQECCYRQYNNYLKRMKQNKSLKNGLPKGKIYNLIIQMIKPKIPLRPKGCRKMIHSGGWSFSVKNDKKRVAGVTHK